MSGGYTCYRMRLTFEVLYGSPTSFVGNIVDNSTGVVVGVANGVTLTTGPQPVTNSTSIYESTAFSFGPALTDIM